MVPVSFLVMAGSLAAVSATGGTMAAPWEEDGCEKRAWRHSCLTVGALLVCLRLIIVSFSLVPGSAYKRQERACVCVEIEALSDRNQAHHENKSCSQIHFKVVPGLTIPNLGSIFLLPFCTLEPGICRPQNAPRPFRSSSASVRQQQFHTGNAEMHKLRIVADHQTTIRSRERVPIICQTNLWRRGDSFAACMSCCHFGGLLRSVKSPGASVTYCVCIFFCVYFLSHQDIFGSRTSLPATDWPTLSTAISSPLRPEHNGGAPQILVVREGTFVLRPRSLFF